MDTIYALSSGRGPAAIAVMRISGPAAFQAARCLAGGLPPPRDARVRALRDGEGHLLDRALTLCFPGPGSATGEDVVEFHLHGGRAVVAAVEAALSRYDGLRPALPGEFTRRGLENGRLDFLQAQGLADLLEAETEGQRRAAFAASEGVIGRTVNTWGARLADLAARLEASIDYADEGDVGDTVDRDFDNDLAALMVDLREVVARPSVERLRDGWLVVLAGPPNAGKSSLFNAMLGRDAAIVSEVSGTTRDVIEASVMREGQAFRLVDTAGLTDDSVDPIERVGIARARAIGRAADLVLWLGDSAEAPANAMTIDAKADLEPHVQCGELSVSVYDGVSIDRLWFRLGERLCGKTYADDIRFHESQRLELFAAVSALETVTGENDDVLRAEWLRTAARHLATITGSDPTESVLDALFSRFCVGK